MQELTNDDLKQFTKYTILRLSHLIGMMDIMIVRNDDTKTVECLKLLQSRLINLHADTQVLEKRLDDYI